MKRLLLLAGIAAGASPLGAQGGAVDVQCAATNPFERGSQDACQKMIDIFQLVAPQIGTSLIGGNILFGDTGALGGLGHVSVGLRITAVRGHLPEVDRVPLSINGATASAFPTSDKAIGLPTTDVAIGILPGISWGRFRILGLDALMNVAYIPNVRSGTLSIRVPGGSIRIGLGGNLTVVEETDATPSVAVSFLQRDLPRSEITATPGDDALAIHGLSINTDAWRATFGKTFGAVSLVVGGGSQTSDAAAIVDVTVNQAGQAFQASNLRVAQRLERRAIFANVTCTRSAIRLVAEVGRTSDGSIATYNTFDGTTAGGALQFASLGLRVRF